jgi:hypothetical protein
MRTEDNSAVIRSYIFCNIMSCSPVKINLRLGGTVLMSACFIVTPCLAYSSDLKIKVICSSETSPGFQWTTWCYIQEDRTLHTHHCKNGKFVFPILLLDFPDESISTNANNKIHRSSFISLNARLSSINNVLVHPVGVVPDTQRTARLVFQIL